MRTSIDLIGPAVVGAILLVAALMKTWNTTPLEAVLRFDRVPGPLLLPTVWIIILSEAVIGSMVLFRIGGIAVLKIALALLLVYSIQLAVLLAVENPPQCACPNLLVMYDEGRWANVAGLIRNGFLAAALVAAITVRRVKVYLMPPSS